MENQQIPSANNEIIAINIFQKPSKYITLDSLMHLDNDNRKNIDAHSTVFVLIY